MQRENRGQLPSATEEARKKKEKERKEELERSKNELRAAISRLSQTADGITFLRWLRVECGFGNSFVAVDSQGNPSEKFTLYQAFRLNLWWKVRKNLPIRQLIEVEHD